MTYLKYAAFAIFALSAINIIFAIGEGEPLFFVVGFAAAFTGIGFLGASEALGYLKDIRDALAPAKEFVETPAASAVSDQDIKSPRSAEEIAADIARMKARQ
ncbi:hypothetical protein [Tropicibacter alexandrii]|uniref:hypothetical protein n=1 Tax=Tropicibacter alexandrii TaxID=2267683 RepID=UPI0010089F2B|nr:hypothetical protein [Tropicibacter alexandrii]